MGRTPVRRMEESNPFSVTAASSKKQTRNPALQAHLNSRLDSINMALAEPEGSPSRLGKILEFCDIFVPKDIEPEDLAHYSQSLLNDPEFFQSLQREIGQCASGHRV